MSIQPTLTPEQQAQLCPACAHGGTSRYCIPGGTCYCQHEACPAYPTSPQRRDPWGNVVGLESRSVATPCETIEGHSQTSETPASAATDRGRDHNSEEES